MSEYNLTIGRKIGQGRAERCLAHLHRIGIIKKGFFGGIKGGVPAWATADQEIAEFCLLNLATVGVFLKFVSSLFARTDADLMKDEIFGNLPWWMDSIWIPADFGPPATFADDPDGPFFLGSIPRLVAALAAVKQKSKLPLGPAPAGYELMRTDLRAFDQTFNGLKDENECVQWVWRGLNDAATLARQEGLPILGNGG